jgi:hypothetical protein
MPVTHRILGYTLLLRRYHYAATDEEKGEILSVLRQADEAKSVSEFFGRFLPFYAPQILQCSLHGEINDKGPCRDQQGTSNSQKIPGNTMRGMRGKTLPCGSPQRQKHLQQCSCEFDDIVCELSHEIALGEWENNAEKGEAVLYDLWKKGGSKRFLSEPLSALHEIWKSIIDKEIGAFNRHLVLRNKNRVHRLKALGNAVVPQIVEVIGRAIMEADNALRS